LGPQIAGPTPATPHPRPKTGMKDYPLLTKGEFMKNKRTCSSYRQRRKKLEHRIAVTTAILRLILILTQIWTLIG